VIGYLKSPRFWLDDLLTIRDALGAHTPLIEVARAFHEPLAAGRRHWVVRCQLRPRGSFVYPKPTRWTWTRWLTPEVLAHRAELVLAKYDAALHFDLGAQRRFAVLHLPDAARRADPSQGRMIIVKGYVDEPALDFSPHTAEQCTAACHLYVEAGTPTNAESKPKHRRDHLRWRDDFLAVRQAKSRQIILNLEEHDPDNGKPAGKKQEDLAEMVGAKDVRTLARWQRWMSDRPLF
jgi:hypothetical protein